LKNDLKYSVRSREIVDLVNAMKNGSLTLSPYFQRNLVWREAHKRDFIDTILSGFPFPQIFLARGPLDIEKMTSSQAVVDGQQRLNAIKDFIEGKLEVNGKFFHQFEQKTKEDFLKYEVAVIDFDLNADDNNLKEIFKRLNRTFYALSAIEKVATEYSASEFLLVARTLAGEIKKTPSTPDEIQDRSLEVDEQNEVNEFSIDPGIDRASLDWITERAEGDFAQLISTKPVFTPFEFDRKLPLMFSLNVMSTYLTGYYNRNDTVQRFLNDYSEVFAEKQEVLDSLNGAAKFILDMALPEDSIWWRKANFFTLIVELSRSDDLRNITTAEAAAALQAFGEAVPSEYALAAREGVNGKAQRELRARFLREILSSVQARAS